MVGGAELTQLGSVAHVQAALQASSSVASAHVSRLLYSKVSSALSFSVASAHISRLLYSKVLAALSLSIFPPHALSPTRAPAYEPPISQVDELLANLPHKWEVLGNDLALIPEHSMVR